MRFRQIRHKASTASPRGSPPGPLRNAAFITGICLPVDGGFRPDSGGQERLSRLQEQNQQPPPEPGGGCQRVGKPDTLQKGDPSGTASPNRPVPPSLFPLHTSPIS